MKRKQDNTESKGPSESQKPSGKRLQAEPERDQQIITPVAPWMSSSSASVASNTVPAPPVHTVEYVKSLIRHQLILIRGLPKHFVAAKLINEHNTDRVMIDLAWDNLQAEEPELFVDNNEFDAAELQPAAMAQPQPVHENIQFRLPVPNLYHGYPNQRQPSNPGYVHTDYRRPSHSANPGSSSCGPPQVTNYGREMSSLTEQRIQQGQDLREQDRVRAHFDIPFSSSSSYQSQQYGPCLVPNQYQGYTNQLQPPNPRYLQTDYRRPVFRSHTANPGSSSYRPAQITNYGKGMSTPTEQMIQQAQNLRDLYQGYTDQRRPPNPGSQQTDPWRPVFSSQNANTGSSSHPPVHITNYGRGMHPPTKQSIQQTQDLSLLYQGYTNQQQSPDPRYVQTDSRVPVFSSHTAHTGSYRPVQISDYGRGMLPSTEQSTQQLQRLREQQRVEAREKRAERKERLQYQRRDS